MNDEEFARSAFRRAMESSFAGEPSGLPSLDEIATRARRATRTKQGVYAGSAIALAGVVTAGVVAGPSALGVGGSAPQTSTADQAIGSGTTTTPAKADLATPCPTPPQIDWAAIIEQSVPGVTATPVPNAAGPDQNICYLMPNLVPSGAMNIEVRLDVSNPKGVVQIDVNTGGDKGGLESPSPADSLAAAAKSAAADERSKADALKSQMLTEKSPGLATNSPANTPARPADPTSTCSGSTQTQLVCATDVSKGGYVGISVALSRATPKPLFVQVVGSTSTPAAGQHAPLSSAQLTAIAEAVASHF